MPVDVGRECEILSTPVRRFRNSDEFAEIRFHSCYAKCVPRAPQELVKYAKGVFAGGRPEPKSSSVCELM